MNLTVEMEKPVYMTAEHTLMLEKELSEVIENVDKKIGLLTCKAKHKLPPNLHCFTQFTISFRGAVPHLKVTDVAVVSETEYENTNLKEL